MKFGFRGKKKRETTKITWIQFTRISSQELVATNMTVHREERHRLVKQKGKTYKEKTNLLEKKAKQFG